MANPDNPSGIGPSMLPPYAPILTPVPILEAWPGNSARYAANAA